MDSFLKNVTSKIDAPAEPEHKPDVKPDVKPDEHQKVPSTSDLFSSAKVVADAAKSKFSNQEFDQGKAAGAAADLLNAGSHYGKLEEDKGLGKMVNQAEDYLHKYSTKTTTTTETHGSGHSTTHTESQETTHEAAPSGGGYGDYAKMAEGFLSKKSDDGGHGDSGGAGDYMKMAGDFLKKN